MSEYYENQAIKHPPYNIVGDVYGLLDGHPDQLCNINGQYPRLNEFSG